MSNSPPICFGKSWEAHHVECNGGLDPAYTHPKRGDHKRDRCSWYTHCASRTAASKLQPEKLVPAANLVKSSMPVMPQPFQAVVQGVRTASQHVAQQVGNIQVRIPNMPAPVAPVQMTPQYPQYQQGYGVMTHPAAASVPYAVPMNYSSPGMQMPAYLTVPEPIIPGQSLVRPFAATMGRSVLKALGHAAANWFDHIPWNPWPYQQQNYWGQGGGTS